MEKNEGGFTLFELVVATVIFGVVGLLIWNMFFTTYNNYKRLNEHKRVLEEVRAITQLIEDEFQRAEEVAFYNPNSEGVEDQVIRKGDVIAEDITLEDTSFAGFRFYKKKGEEVPDRVPDCVIKWGKDGIGDGELYYGNEDKEQKFSGEKVSEHIKKITISKVKDSDILNWEIVMPNISDKKVGDNSAKDLENILGEKVYRMSTSLQYKYSGD